MNKTVSNMLIIALVHQTVRSMFFGESTDDLIPNKNQGFHNINHMDNFPDSNNFMSWKGNSLIFHVDDNTNDYNQDYADRNEQSGLPRNKRSHRSYKSLPDHSNIDCNAWIAELKNSNGTCKFGKDIMVHCTDQFMASYQELKIAATAYNSKIQDLNNTIKDLGCQNDKLAAQFKQLDQDFYESDKKCKSKISKIESNHKAELNDLTEQLNCCKNTQVSKNDNNGNMHIHHTSALVGMSLE